jgi:hypothetical protein
MKRRPDRGVEPVPEPAVAVSPNFTSGAKSYSRTLNAVGEEHGDHVIDTAGERLARVAKIRSLR